MDSGGSDRRWGIIFIISCIALYGLSLYSKGSGGGSTAGITPTQTSGVDTSSTAKHPSRTGGGDLALAEQVESLQTELISAKTLIARLQKKLKAAKAGSDDASETGETTETPEPVAPAAVEYDEPEVLSSPNPSRSCSENSIESLVPAKCPPAVKRPKYPKHAFVPRCFQDEVLTTIKCVRVVNVVDPIKRMAVHSGGEVISQQIARDRAYDAGTAPSSSLRKFLNYLKEDTTGKKAFLDVGANLGWYGLWVANDPAMLKRPVYQFEVQANNIERLLATKCMRCPSDLTHLHVFYNAIGGSSGEEVSIYLNPGNAGMSHVGDSDNRPLGGGRVLSNKVTTLTIDDSIFGTTPQLFTEIQLMKIDVEGFEGLAMAGAKRMLKEMPPKYVDMEFVPFYLNRSPVGPRALLRIMRDAGYEVLESPYGTDVFDKIDTFDESTTVWGDIVFRHKGK